MSSTDSATGNLGESGLQGPSLVIEASADGMPVLPEGFSVTTADFARAGADLVLTAADGTQVLIQGYFALPTPPALVSAEGAVIAGELAVKLAGPMAPGQYAQASLETAQPIGTVETLTGDVVAVRADGTRVELEVGDPVFQGDIVESGAEGAIGIVLADETTFSMAENGRIVLDEMIYDAGTQEGSVSLSIVQGIFTFVSGQVAKADPDAMTVVTPVATIGIRGTQLGVTYIEGEEMILVLMQEMDGFVGEVVVTNAAGFQILNLPNMATTVASADTAPSVPAPISEAQIIETFGTALSSLPENDSANDYGTGEEEESEAEDEDEELDEEVEEEIEEEGEEEEAAGEGEEGDEDLEEFETADEDLEEFETAAGDEADITQMTSRFAEIIPPYHRRGNGIPFAAIRWPDFGDQPSVGRPFGQICRHSDTLLLSFSPRRRCPRPTPERVLVADHRSGSGFSGTVPSAPPPRPIGT